MTKKKMKKMRTGSAHVERVVRLARMVHMRKLTKAAAVVVAEAVAEGCKDLRRKAMTERWAVGEL